LTPKLANPNIRPSDSAKPACRTEKAERAFSQLIIKDEPRPEFIDKYSRSNIMKKMAEDILSLGNN
jgi:hypothetical protein